MELLTLAAIIAGIIAVIIGLIVVIKKISAFYILQAAALRQLWHGT